MKRFYLILSVVFILLITGCSALTGSPSTGGSSDVSKHVAVPSPAAGKAVVAGKLFNKADNSPIADRLVQLAKVYGEGKDSIYVYNESSDPGAYTTMEGYLVIPDVEPGLYAVILIDANGNYAPINESAEKIVTVNVEAGKTIDVGNVAVDLSAPKE